MVNLSRPGEGNNTAEYVYIHLREKAAILKLGNDALEGGRGAAAGELTEREASTVVRPDRKERSRGAGGSLAGG